MYPLPKMRLSRRVVLATAVVLGLGVPTSSALLAADATAVNGAALSTSLQPAKRIPGSKTTVVPPPPPPTTAPAPAGQSAAERAVLDRVNAERTSRGIAPLTWHVQLAQAADIHGNDQRNRPCASGFLTHTGTDGSSPGDRIKRTGLSVRNWGENIACRYTSAQAVMDGWMASSGHRANILNSSFTHIGVSLTFADDGTAYWVQVFGLPR